MVLTRKDFINQANIIAQTKDPTAREAQTKSWAQVNRMSNPRFDEGRFRDFINKKAQSTDARRRKTKSGNIWLGTTIKRSMWEI